MKLRKAIKLGSALLIAGSLAACGGGSTSSFPDSWNIDMYDTDSDGIITIQEATSAWATLSVEQKAQVAEYYGISVSTAEWFYNTYSNDESEVINIRYDMPDQCTWQNVGEQYGGEITTSINQGSPTTNTIGGDVMTVTVQEGDFMVTYTFQTSRIDTTTTPQTKTTHTAAIYQDQACT